MSRTISAHTVTMAVTEKMTRMGGNLNAEDIRTVLSDITHDLVCRVTLDIDAAAFQVVEQDYKATLDEFPGNFVPLSALHTIANIKRVRELTGTGLKEARDAVRIAVAKVYRNLADNALRHLAMANTDNPSYATRSYVDAVEHRYVLQNVMAAADEPAF